MFRLKDIIEDELNIINYELEMLDNADYGEVPEGKLYKYSTRKDTRYELKQSKKGNRKSKRIGNDYSKEVILIKQFAYNSELRKRLVHNKKILEKLYGSLLCCEIESVDEALPETYRDYTGMVNKNPSFMSMEEWLTVPYAKNSVEMPENTNVTSDGRRVRSKSEVIIYDLLRYLGIPFRYEANVELRNENNEKVYKNADFLILTKGGGKIIVEHMGMLGHEDYFEKALHKVRLYILNGYSLNETLFLTADDVDGKIDAYSSKLLFENLLIPRL